MGERADDPIIAAVVTAAVAGDRLSWEELVERYGGMVQAVVSGFRLQEADAADAVQNTWLRAVERLGALREPERFGGWLKTIAYRECLALHGHTRREHLDGAVAEHIPDQTPGPEAQALRAEMCRAVRAAVDTLTGRRRILVEALFYRPCIDYSLAAQSAGMPVGSIGPTRARTLRTLRERLEQTGFAPCPAVAAAARTR
jgi:RNA polymerase sigma factor (sigma-70 family)